MRRSASGNYRSRTRASGLWFAILLGLLSTARPASAFVERRLWVWAAQPFLSTETKSGVLRHQINLKGSSFSDVILTSLAAQFDFRFAELSVFASEKNFLETSDQTGDFLNQYQREQHYVGGEIARYFASRYGVYGRLGLQYWYAVRSTQSVVVLGLDTGTFGEAWNFNIRTRFHVFLNGAGNLVANQVTVYRSWDPLSVGFMGGASFWLKQHLQTTGSGSQITEAMLFSVGPYLQFTSGRFTVQSTLPMIRLSRDNESINGVTSHPTESSIGIDAKLNVVL